MHGVLGRCLRVLHNKSLGVLLLRLALGAFFLGHGISKLQNIDMMVQFFASLDMASYWAYVVAISEIVSGAALILGAFLWVAAFLITVMMGVAIYKVTGPNNVGQSVLVHYLSGWGTNLIYAISAIALALCGAGRWSLAAVLMRRRVKSCNDCRKEDCSSCKKLDCPDCRADHGMGHNCPTCPPEHA